jgi:hypothetical protein
MKTFLNGAFDTKVESTMAEATELARNCEATFPEENVEGSEWAGKLVKLKGVKESLIQLRLGFSTKVKEAGDKADKAVSVAEVEKILEEFDVERAARYVDFKTHSQCVAVMIGAVKRKEAKLRDDAGHSKKRRKAMPGGSGAAVPSELVDAGSGNGGWDAVLTFLFNTFATTNEKLSVHNMAADTICERPCLATKAELGKQLNDLAVLKALFKWCEAQCQSIPGARTAMAASLSQVSHRAKLEGLISQTCAVGVAEIFVRPFSASEPWLQELFVPQVVFFAGGHSSCSMAPFGLPVAFAPTGGTLIVAGFKVESMMGETLAAKIEHLKQSSLESIAQTLKQEPNFFCKLTANNLLVVPAGYVLVQFSPEPCKVVRWSFLKPGPVTALAGISYLTMMLQASPALNRIANYPKLLEHLKLSRAKVLGST